jgi:hypothetical protein
MGVAADDDGLGPAGHEAGHVGADNGLTEDSSIEDVTDGAVGGFPHLFQLELLDTFFIGGDGSALDTNFVLLDGVGRLDSDLVICGVTVLNGEIVVLEIDVDIGSDVLYKIYIVNYHVVKYQGMPVSPLPSKFLLFKLYLASFVSSKSLTLSLIHFQMMRVISSPSSSTTGLATLTFWKVAKFLLAKALASILES